MNLPQRLPRSFYHEILSLIEKQHIPRVRIGTSTIRGADQGVFAKQNIPVSVPFCLYPGVYTPGLPSFAIADDSIIYLANEETLPPSGIPFDENAYILNMPQVGGYLDGLALSGENTAISQQRSNSNSRRRLDENPSACAHKINHSFSSVNARIVPFFWDGVLKELCKENETAEVDTDCYALPNVIRNDGSPWYLDGSTNKVWFFNNDSQACCRLCGAAVCATRMLQPGDEVFLDYSLKSPLPLWATNWYEST